MIHFENLRLYLMLGLKLKKKKKKSHQSQWLKQYVDFNTQKKNRSRKKQGQRWKSIL